MNISSINTNIAATATTAPAQVSTLISSIANAANNVAVSSTVATAVPPVAVATTTPSPPPTTVISNSVPSAPAATKAPVANKLNSDWLKIKVTNPLSTEASRPVVAIVDDNKDSKADNLKTSKTTTPANFVKHKLNVSTASTNSSGNIQIHLIQPSGIISSASTATSGISVIQPPNTLTLSSAPKSIIKTSTALSSPTTTAVNLAQLSTKSTLGPVANSNTTNSNNGLNIPTTVNVNNRKINVGPSQANTKITLHSTTPSSSATSNANGASAGNGITNTVNTTSSTINNLVKNILSSNSPNNTATANAAVAVTAAANIFSQMNAENGAKIISKASPPHPIVTTSATNNTTSSGTDSNQTTGNNPPPAPQVVKTTNQINLPSTTLNINSSQAQSQLPKITVLSNLGNSNSTTKTIKQAPNRVITDSGSNITKTTVPISLKPSSNSTSQHQQLIPINSASNGQISNIVSGINLKSLSPISFLPATSPNDAASSSVGFVNSKITNLANTRTVTTTPPPTAATTSTTPITLSNNQPQLTINTANISNYISKSSNSTGNVYKAISQGNESEDNNNNNNNHFQPTTVHNFTNSNSQTIAQLCSGLNNQFQIQQNANGTTLQPIRLIQGNNNPNNNQLAQQQPNASSKIYQNNVQLQQITLNSSMLTSNQQHLGNNNNAKKATSNNSNPSNSSGNIISSMPQSSASPSASPLKPNIIRKPRRDSPNHANLQNITEKQNQILNVQAANLYNQTLSGKHPIYELTQSALIDSNAKQTKINLDNQQQPAEQQFYSLPSSSSVSSSSSTHHHIQLPSGSNNPRSIVNLIADSNNPNNDATKNIRKFTLNTQLNIPTSAPKDSWASTSSYASSSSTTAPNNQNNNSNPNLISSQINSKKPSADSMPTSSAVPTSSQQIQLDKQPSNISATQSTSRKRRKQEFKAKNPEDQVISYNANPLSNNAALAYSVNTTLSPNSNTRYLNENTNINNSIKQSSEQQNVMTISDAGSSALMQGFYNCGNELTIADVSMYGNEEEERSHKKMRGPDTVEDDEYDECLDDETVKLLSKEFSYVASNGVTWTSKKNRSRFAITKCYKTTWKPRSHHYVRYSDIKMKDKAKNSPTVISQKELYDNLNEWKFHFVISQVQNLIGFENESLNVIDDIENLMQEQHFFDGNYSDISIKINESIKANNQRHKHVNEQLDEAQQLIHKLFDHKEKFTKYLLMSSNDKSFNGSNNNSNSTINAKNNSTPANSTSKSNKFSSGGGNKKGISTRSSQMKNSMHRSNLSRSSAACGSPKSSKS